MCMLEVNSLKLRFQMEYLESRSLANCVLKDSPLAASEISEGRHKELRGMSYETMETLLIERIAEIRASEALIANSFQRHNPGALVKLEYSRLQTKMGEVERLLAAMDGAASVSAGAF